MAPSVAWWCGSAVAMIVLGLLAGHVATGERLATGSWERYRRTYLQLSLWTVVISRWSPECALAYGSVQARRHSPLAFINSVRFLSAVMAIGSLQLKSASLTSRHRNTGIWPYYVGCETPYSGVPAASGISASRRNFDVIDILCQRIRVIQK